jgi:acetylornithine deacetylase/succinyl-diaminopimelate desuccinylase-like protein
LTLSRDFGLVVRFMRSTAVCLPVLVFVLTTAGACATTHAPRAADPALQGFATAVDWQKAGDETLALLADYLRVDTRNPPGNESAGARFMAQVLEKEGIPSTVHEFAPGRGSLVARLPATGAKEDKPLCLLSHLDVVPAEDAEWPADAQPLSGVVKDGFLWGRGALDMKGMGALELMTMVLLKRGAVPLKRDVVLIAVADEEVHNGGMHLLVDTLWNELDCGVLVNEGGVGLSGLLFPNQTVYPITVAEKGTLWLKLVAQGEAGHGSTPVPTRAPAKLARVVSRLFAREPKPQIHPALYELLARAGENGGGLTGFVLQHQALVDLLAVGKLMAKPPTRATITNTCQVTGYDGKGSAPNVIPSEVSAIVDCRALPSASMDALLDEVKAIAATEEGVRVEVLQREPGSESSWDDPFFDALVRNLIAGRPGVVAGPAISPGFTDSNLARPKGARAYGIVPFELDAELLGTMHGKNERVPVKEVRRGVEVLFRSVVEAAGRAR